MNRTATTLLLALALACAASSTASAGSPSPDYSSVPTCMVAVPQFPPTAVIVVRDIDGLPVENASVVIDFTGCDQLYLCPDVPPNAFPRFAPSPVSTMTDFYGMATFNLHGGGSCLAGATISADGVLLGTVRILSPDQDADGDVDAADLVLLQSRIAANDLRADLGCDGLTNGNDELAFGNYLGAFCTGPTPTRSTTWGRLKQHYR